MWSSELDRRAAEMRERNERDRLATRLGREHLRIAEATATTGAIERHYTVKEIGALWKLSTATVARLFRNEPGVLKLGRDQPRRGRRSYTMQRIPQSVVEASTVGWLFDSASPTLPPLAAHFVSDIAA